MLGVTEIFNKNYMIQRIEDLTMHTTNLERALKNAERVLSELSRLPHEEFKYKRYCAYCGAHESEAHMRTCELAKSLQEIQEVLLITTIINQKGCTNMDRLKEIEKRVEGDLKPLWGKLQTVDDVRYLLDLVKMQQVEIERLKRRKSSGQDPLEVYR